MAALLAWYTLQGALVFGVCQLYELSIIKSVVAGVLWPVFFMVAGVMMLAGFDSDDL